MKWILLIGIVFLVSCSQIPYDERVIYCNERGLEYAMDYANGWRCKLLVNDLDYIIEKHSTPVCPLVNCSTVEVSP